MRDTHVGQTILAGDLHVWQSQLKGLISCCLKASEPVVGHPRSPTEPHFRLVAPSQLPRALEDVQ